MISVLLVAATEISERHASQLLIFSTQSVSAALLSSQRCVELWLRHCLFTTAPAKSGIDPITLLAIRLVVRF
jgi:hypothetical protein